MAGTPHGLVNLLLASTEERNQSFCRNAFAAVAAFFEHLCTPAGGSYMTRIACYWGTGASGWDRTGGANPAGENAFGVWRLNTSARRPGGGTELGAIYFFLAWAYSENPSGWLGRSYATYDGCALGGAFREDGGSPWAGTTNNDGTDTKATPLWTAGGSVVHCLCLSNNVGGSYAVNKNNCFALFGGNKNNQENQYFAHIVADEDSIYITGTTITTKSLQMDSCLVTTYNINDNITPGKYNLLSMNSYREDFTESFIIGSTTGSSTREGNLVDPTSTDRQFYNSPPARLVNAAVQPNEFSAGGSAYDELPSSISTTAGWVGWMDNDLARFVYGPYCESYDPVKKRACFGYGHSSVQYLRISVPWPDSIGEFPGQTRTYDGVAF